MITNWNSGQMMCDQKVGTILSCSTLNSGQIYAMFLYNSAGADTSIQVQASINNVNPTWITIPGTTANQGLASLVFFSGNDGMTVNLVIPNNAQNGNVQTGSITAWLGSVSMPTNTTGFNNYPLPTNGQPQSFNQLNRWYAVPSSTWWTYGINGNGLQLITVMFTENSAIVNVVNNPGSFAIPVVYTIGNTIKQTTLMPPAPNTYCINAVSNNTLTQQIFGNGTQYVWMNADSSQNSNGATIYLQKS